MPIPVKADDRLAATARPMTDIDGEHPKHLDTLHPRHRGDDTAGMGIAGVGENDGAIGAQAANKGKIDQAVDIVGGAGRGDVQADCQCHAEHRRGGAQRPAEQAAQTSKPARNSRDGKAK